MSKTQPGPRKRAKAEKKSSTGRWNGHMRLWVDIGGRGAIGPGKLRLLDAIATANSLSAAAKKLNMSYRLAWKHLQLIEERIGLNVVERQRGGASGGGSNLTPEGKQLLKAYKSWREETEEFMAQAFEQHFAAWTGSAAKQK